MVVILSIMQLSATWRNDIVKRLMKSVWLITIGLLIICSLVYAWNRACLVRYDLVTFEGLEVGQSATVMIDQLQERYAPFTPDGILYEYPLTNGQYIQIYVWGEEYIIQKISTADTACDFSTIWFPLLSLFVK